MKRQGYFKFLNGEEVVKKQKENEPLIVVGCAVYINNQKVYLCQDKKLFEEVGYMFTQCEWIYEHELILVK